MPPEPSWPGFDEVVRGQAVRGSARLEQAALEQANAGRLDIDPEQWWAASTTELELIREVETALLAEAHQRVAQGSQDQWRQTGLVTGATVLILLVSLLTSVGIGRSMARSLRRLRDQAMDVAHIQLPGLLARLRGSRGAVPAVAGLVAGGPADGTPGIPIPTRSAARCRASTVACAGPSPKPNRASQGRRWRT